MNGILLRLRSEGVFDHAIFLDLFLSLAEGYLEILEARASVRAQTSALVVASCSGRSADALEGESPQRAKLKLWSLLRLSRASSDTLPQVPP